MKRLGILLPPGWDASPSQGYPQHWDNMRGRRILLSLVWLQTELDSTQSYDHYLLPILVFFFNLS